ncbi:MAG: alanine racemase [Bacteroidota bacterium]
MAFELTIKQVGELLDAKIHGKRDMVIRHLAIDSRTLARTENTLFIALVGEQHDGHDYLEELYRRGVRAFLVSRFPKEGSFEEGSYEEGSYEEAGFCVVEDTLTALQMLALARRQAFGGMVAAVTGSNGKTIVKEWIYQCLRDRVRIYRSPKSYNSQVGVPLSVWMISDTDEMAVLEAGISRTGEMQRLQEIIRPQVGLFTNLGTAHQENFSDLKEKLAEKLSLFTGCEKVICRADVAVEDRPLKEYFSERGIPVVDWSLTGDSGDGSLTGGSGDGSSTDRTGELPVTGHAKDGSSTGQAEEQPPAGHARDLPDNESDKDRPPAGRARDLPVTGDTMYRYAIRNKRSFHTELTVSCPAGDNSFSLPFSDEASIENALHTLTFILETGTPLPVAVQRIAEIEPVSMRLEMLQGILGSVVINDAYNADIGGLSSALDLLNQQDRKKGRVLILSDLLQSGMQEEELYDEISRLIDQKGTDHFIGIGPALMRQRNSFPRSSDFYSDTEEFLGRMDRTLFRDKTILVKGSRKFGFERITRELQLKTHQTVLEIDLNAMVHNLNTFRSLLGEGVKTMVMVKALTYGSGSTEIAGLLQFHQVDYLAVAFIDEGVELRRAGIYLPIMVMNPVPSGFGQMLDYHLEPEIYGFGGLKRLYDLIRYRGIKHYPVHIKMDTGMHRLGFMEEEIDELLPLLDREEFRVVSVFTHLASSDDPQHDDFTGQQIRDFEHLVSSFSKVLPGNFLRHVLNSSGIERFPEAQYEMVRLGIGLHGIGSLASLKPASSFKTSISQVRKLKAGETVGYSRAGKVDRDSLIATLPVGYADGLNRKLGNGAGRVWTAGKMVPVAGNICMDMTMIDVTGLNVSEGEEVEIFGRHQSVSEMARRAGTIPYEILTSIPTRVKRVYLQE